MVSNKSVNLNNGQQMPTVGLGTFAATGDVMRETLKVALECGYRSIDTAYLYENEDAIGDELQEWLTSGKLKREDIFVTSKLPAIGNRKGDVNRFLKKTLKDLKLNYVDLYLVHHPFGFLNKGDSEVMPKDEQGNSLMDFDTDITSVWKEMEKQVDLGLTKAIGISNFNIDQVERIMKIARIAPVVNQVEAHVYLQQKPLMAACKKFDIVLCAYGPLGAPYRGSGSEEFPTLIEHPRVLEIANRREKSPAQILLKFLIQHGFVVIPKSATPERIRQNFQIFDFELTESENEILTKIDRDEDGRVLTFMEIFKGCENHKEYPFRRP